MAGMPTAADDKQVYPSILIGIEGTYTCSQCFSQCGERFVGLLMSRHYTPVQGAIFKVR